MKVHLDTDLGGDVDDICALALLLQSPDVELTGITTVAEENGRRAGYIRHVLDLVARQDIPVSAGANVANGFYRYDKLDYPSDERNWGKTISPSPNPIDDALNLLKQSIEQGATIIGIGPYTNLRLVNETYPNILRDMPLYLMGGHVYDIPAGFPQWGNQDDWNIQVDVTSAKYVLEHAHPTLIPLTVTAQTSLHRTQLSRLSQAGKLGNLLVSQIEYFADYEGYEATYGETCPALPDDFINFQHDPLATAIAIGWRDGVEIEMIPLRFEIRDSYLHEIPDKSGIPTQVVTKIDSGSFSEYWCDRVCNKD